MLLSRDLMLRKWILLVGSALPLALTSLAHQPMRLVSKHLKNSKEQVPCPVACHVAFRPRSHACLCSHVHLFHLWQRMKNTACAKILFVSLLVLLYSCYYCYSPKWIGFVLGAIFVYVNDQNMRNFELQWNFGDCGLSFLLKIVLLSSPSLAGRLYFGDFLTLGGTSFLQDLPSFYLRKEPCKILHRQCMWSMLCCYENEHQKMYTMLFYYVFAFGVEFSNFHQNLARALHCHDNWGFTSLSTLMICRLLVVFLYLFLNILCGILSGMSL